VGKAGKEGSGVVCNAAESAGPETGGAETTGAEITGATAGVFVTVGVWCFRAKMMLAATRIIAAAADEVTRISAVEFDLVGSFGCDDGGVNLAAVTKCSAAGTVAACGGGSCVSG